MTTAGAPMIGGQREVPAHVAVYLFVIIPPLATLAIVPLTWGWGLRIADAVQFAFWYTATFLGVTIGFHRYLTHRSFKAKRWLHVTLAIAGSMAVQGPVLHWVADHRRHHAFADRIGDPHSPWLFGTTPAAILRGFWHAHVGWILNRDLTNQQRFAPDLLRDRDITVVHRSFGMWTAITMLAPPLIGGLASWSFSGALSAFFWASMVRVAAVHHVTWSINSICHMFGRQPFTSRDRSTNFWPLALVSMGESWHNLHHCDPTCARHGVRKRQIDVSARVIWIFERLGWAYDVRWPTDARMAHIASRDGGS